MSFLKNLTDLLPFGRSEEESEYFFALNVGPEALSGAVWGISRHKLEIIKTANEEYASLDALLETTDKLLDKTLGDFPKEPEKILFGVPDSWLLDDNLKDQYLTVLRRLVKELELKPMAYVATSHALAHYLEKKEGAPITAIVVGIDKGHVNVTVMRGGKLDGSRVGVRSDNIGDDIEKLLLSFSDIEVLPSKILIYGSSDLAKQKANLLSFPWMSKLSFLHFPKIEILEEGVEIKAVCLAGAVEISGADVGLDKKELAGLAASGIAKELLEPEFKGGNYPEEDLGFSTGDVLSRQTSGAKKTEKLPSLDPPDDFNYDKSNEEVNREAEYSDNLTKEEDVLPGEVPPSIQPRYELSPEVSNKLKFDFAGKGVILGVVGVIALAILGYVLLPKAVVSVYVEPRVLEKDSQVTADPTIKSVDENAKKIPGEIIETQISGSEKAEATGKKQVGDSAKGTVIVYNKTDTLKTFTKGTTLSATGGLKFTLDNSVTVASQSAIDGGIAFGKETASVTAASIGPDGNLPSGFELTFSNLSTSQFSAKAEGNFSGGTSKDVTVVTDSDQKKLLATLASTLRKRAQEELQAKYPEKKILEEALLEEISKKTYNKDVNDQAIEFTLNLTIRYKGTAYKEQDLKSIVSKLVETNVPEDFELSLAESETQADVSKLEKDGRLIFLARFKAKLLPKIDTDDLRNKIKGKTPAEAAEILRSYDNILGSEIKITPPLPASLQRLPILDKNIQIEVGLK